MRFYRLALPFSLVLAVMPVRAQSDADGHARAEAALRTLAKGTSGQYHFAFTVRGQDSLIARAGTVAFRRRGNDLMVRVEDEEGVWGVGRESAWMLSHRNGKVYVDSTGEAFQASYAVLQMLNPVLTPQLIGAYLIGSATVDVTQGDACTALEARFEPARNQVRGVRYCLDARHLPLELRYTFDDDSELYLDLRDYDVSADVPDHLFEPPADAPTVQMDAYDADFLAPGLPAPPFSLADAEGQMHHLADLRCQVVLVDFWGTWCGPCLAAFPDVQALHERFGAQGLVVLGVASYESDEAEPAAVAAEHGVTYRILTGGETIADAYGVNGVPTYYLIGRDGTVRYAAYHPGDYAALESAIETALAE